MQVTLGEARTVAQEVRAWRQARWQEAVVQRAQDGGASVFRVSEAPARGGSAAGAPGTLLADRMTLLLARVDTDGDGKITSRELAAAGSRQDVPARAAMDPAIQEGSRAAWAVRRYAEAAQR